MQDPNFWSQRIKAKEISQKVSELKKEITATEHYIGETASLLELCEISAGDEAILSDIEKKRVALEKEFREFELSRIFTGPYDTGNAAMYIYAGAGGKDSEDWVVMLCHMYKCFAEKRGWKIETVHEHWGEFKGPSGQGLKNVSLVIKGKGPVYGYLKKETGVHRLVRISPFSANDLRHTSFAMVEVMPEFVAPEEVEIKPDDISTDFFRSSGPGGQNVNKRETAVRITHIPTGLTVAVQTERSQERNREQAMNMIRARLYQKKISEQKKVRQEVRGETVSAEWGHQIRSYVLHPYTMVKDHRTNTETGNVEAVLNGELDEFVEAELIQ